MAKDKLGHGSESHIGYGFMPKRGERKDLGYGLSSAKFSEMPSGKKIPSQHSLTGKK